MVTRSGQPLRRPLIGIALAIIAGMYLASLGILKIGLAILIALGLLIAACMLRHSSIATILVFGVIASVSAVRFLIPAIPSGNTILQMCPELPKKGVEVVGRVSGPTKYHAFKRGDRGMWIFPLTLEGIKDQDGWKTCGGEVDVRVMGALESAPSAEREQRVWLKGELQERNYKGGNPVGLKVAWPRYCRGLSPPRFSLHSQCAGWRETAAKRLENGIADKPIQLAVLRSLVLGFRNEIPSDTYDFFKRTGSLHIFAISGLHVGIVGLLLVIILKSMGVQLDWFGIWLIPLLFIYVMATGMKASAMRAMVMAGVFLLAPLFRRRPDIPSSVAFAAILLLLLNPFEIQSAGFIFSFVVVVFIVMVYSVVPRTMLKGAWIRTYGLSLVITSVAASLASIPMTIYYFGRFSPVALVGNLAVVPLTFCIVLSGWLSILIPAGSVVFNHASIVFINAMLLCVQQLDRIPGSSMLVSAPPALSIILWYGSLIYLLTHATCRRQRLWAVAGAGSSILVGLLG